MELVHRLGRLVFRTALFVLMGARWESGRLELPQGGSFGVKRRER